MLLLCLLALVARAHAYATASLTAACDTQFPIHGYPLTDGDGGHHLTFPFLSVLVWQPGVPVSILLGDAFDPEPEFKGLMMTAYPNANCSYDNITTTTGATRKGTWTSIPSGYKTYCGAASTIAHSSALSKTHQQFTWVPPAAGAGDITFHATVVDDLATFYRIRSPTLQEFIPCTGYCAHGDCTEGDVTPTCVCDPNWSGSRCSISGPACGFSPCQNGGTCTDGATNDNFTCSCLTGFTDSVCGTVLQPCDLSPCSNGGTCGVVDSDSYVCGCQSGFTGTLCDEEIPSGESEGTGAPGTSGGSEEESSSSSTGEALPDTSTADVVVVIHDGVNTTITAPIPRDSVLLTNGALAGIVVGSVVGGVLLSLLVRPPAAARSDPAYVGVPMTQL